MSSADIGIPIRKYIKPHDSHDCDTQKEDSRWVRRLDGTRRNRFGGGGCIRDK